MCGWLILLLNKVNGVEIKVNSQTVQPRRCNVSNENLAVLPAFCDELIDGFDEYTINVSDITSDKCLSNKTTGLTLYVYDSSHEQSPSLNIACSDDNKTSLNIPCEPGKWNDRITVPLKVGHDNSLAICNCDEMQPIDLITYGKVTLQGSWGYLPIHTYPLVTVTELFSYSMFVILIFYIIICIKRRHRVGEAQKCILAFFSLSFIYALVVHHCYYELNMAEQNPLVLTILRDVIGACYRLLILVSQICLSVGWGVLYITLMRRWLVVVAFSLAYVVLTVMRDTVEYFIGHTYNILIPLMQIPMVIFNIVSYFISNKCVGNMINQLEFHDDTNGVLLYRRQYVLNAISSLLLLSESALRIVHFFMYKNVRLSYYWIVMTAFLNVGVLIYSISLAILWRPRDIYSFSKVTKIVEEARASLFGDVEEIGSPITDDMIISASVAKVIEDEGENAVTINMPHLDV